MPFMVAAGIGAAGSLASGIIGSNAASSGAKAQENAAQLASNTELSMFNTAQSDLQPYMQGGTNALAALQKILGIGPGGSGATNPMLQMLGIGANGQATGGGIDPSKFQSSPGYQFQMQQGEDAITNSNAAKGIGGNALKQLQSYGQGTANQGWQQYLSNLSGAYGNLTDQLSNLVGRGQGAAGGVASAAMGLGSEIGGNQIGAGNAQASGTIGSANALGGALQGIGSNAMQYGLATNQNNNLQAILTALQSGGGGASSGGYGISPYGANNAISGNTIMSAYG